MQNTAKKVVQLLQSLYQFMAKRFVMVHFGRFCANRNYRKAILITRKNKSNFRCAETLAKIARGVYPVPSFALVLGLACEILAPLGLRILSNGRRVPRSCPLPLASLATSANCAYATPYGLHPACPKTSFSSRRDVAYAPPVMGNIALLQNAFRKGQNSHSKGKEVCDDYYSK